MENVVVVNFLVNPQTTKSEVERIAILSKDILDVQTEWRVLKKITLALATFVIDVNH